MNITLSEELATLALEKADAAGYQGRVAEYVAYLIASDEPLDYGAPEDLSLAGKSREQIEAMIDVGMQSGPSTSMTEADWETLHNKVGRT